MQINSNQSFGCNTAMEASVKASGLMKKTFAQMAQAEATGNFARSETLFNRLEKIQGIADNSLQNPSNATSLNSIGIA